MTTTVTTHSSSVRVARIGSLTTLATSMGSSSVSSKVSMSLPSSPVSVTGMSGLLSSRNLVQDEKLVVATLATLDSGSASSLIKQDLKWIIQSRRKAEGKAELQVEFKKPIKDEQLTSEELIKRARRRELNRLAARRSREKGQKRKDMLVELIRKLQSQNSDLMSAVGDLTEEKKSIVQILRHHLKQCSDYHATQSAAVGISQGLLDLLGYSSLNANQTELPGVSDLCIYTDDSSSSHPEYQGPSVSVKKEKYTFSSCPSSPLVMGLSGKSIKVEETSVLSSGNIIHDDTASMINSSVFSLNSPAVSYSIPITNPQFESPPLPLSIGHLPPCINPTHISNASSVTSHSTIDAGGEDEVIHYKHKLMKHRKQFSDFTEIRAEHSSAVVRGTKMSLERSLSFPCTVRESWSNLNPSSSGPYKVHLACTDLSSSTSLHTSTVTALDAGSERDGASFPLDLAVQKSDAYFCESNQERQFMGSPMDTWPPPGIRSGMSLRNFERRRSVDDRQSMSQPLSEPLNLSSKSILENEMPTISQTNTAICPSHKRTDVSYSSFTVDHYR